MTAFASLTIADSAAANVVFTPQSIDSNGVARWLDANSIFDAKRTVTMQVSLAKNGSSVNRIKQKVVVPIMDTVDTSKKVAEAIITVEAVLPKVAGQAVRLDMKAFAANMLANAVSTAAFTSLESIY